MPALRAYGEIAAFVNLMRNIASMILLLACVTFAAPMTVDGKRPKPAPVVAKFGGECESRQFHHSTQLERLIQKNKASDWPCHSSLCNAPFVYDLNGDRKPEFFVR